MKPKLLLGLALVLSGGLIGCSATKSSVRLESCASPGNFRQITPAQQQFLKVFEAAIAKNDVELLMPITDFGLLSKKEREFTKAMILAQLLVEAHSRDNRIYSFGNLDADDQRLIKQLTQNGGVATLPPTVVLRINDSISSRTSKNLLGEKDGALYLVCFREKNEKIEPASKSSPPPIKIR